MCNVIPVFQDIRHAFRVLRRSPYVAAAAVTALALGIGANTAIFSLMNAVVFRPLPYPNPDRLVYVSPTEGGHAMTSASWPVFRHWQQQTRTLEGLAAYTADNSATLTGDGEPLRVFATPVTPGIFTVLGAAPLVGTLDASVRTVVLSYGFWLRRLGGHRAALGRTLVLDGEPYTIAGILPPDFRFPRWMFMAEPDIYLPLRPNPDPKWHYLRVIGRLKERITLAQAQAEMDVISAATQPGPAEGKRAEGVELEFLADNLTYGTRDTLAAFAAAVLLVLLIACANVSNLLLGQAVRRRREIAVRSALGASRARLVRQFLIEATVLAVGGGVAGVLLAMWGMPLLMAIVPAASALGVRMAMGGIGLDWTVLGFAVAVALMAALLAGLLPAWRASRPEGSAQFLASRGERHERVRGILIGTEVALSLVLLASTGLLVKSLVRLLTVDPGFNTRNLLTVEVELPQNKYPEVRQRAEFVRSALERLEQIPGVSAAAAINVMPLTKSNVTNSFTLLGPSPQGGSAGFRAVTPRYFETMGIPLIHGRLPARGETEAAVINQAMVRRFSPDGDPLGREIETERIERVRTAEGWMMRISPERFRIIGVVGDVRHLSLAYDPKPEMFLPASRMAAADATFVVRSRLDRDALEPAVRRAILAVDPDQPVGEIRSLGEIISQDLSGRQFVLVLLGIFAALALVLAAAGIFAVVSHSVSQRTREIGIRMALGANAAAVVGAVVRQTLAWVAAGLFIGCAGWLAASRTLRAYLFRVDPGDPAVFAAATVVLAAIAACAAFVPARAAAHIDPAHTLRFE